MYDWDMDLNGCMDSAIRMLGLKTDFFGPHHFFLSVSGGQHLQLPKGANGCHAKHAKPQRTHAQISVAFLAVWLCCLSAFHGSRNPN